MLAFNPVTISHHKHGKHATHIDRIMLINIILMKVNGMPLENHCSNTLTTSKAVSPDTEALNEIKLTSSS
jgi:hypothetical protein